MTKEINRKYRLVGCRECFVAFFTESQTTLDVCPACKKQTEYLEISDK